MKPTSARHSRSTGPAMAPASLQQEGLVVASYGRHCLVQSPDGSQRLCHPRGKKNQAVVGDRVRWQAPPPGQGEEGSIEAVLPRRNLFYRQDALRTKSFAANLDQILILLAAEPVFSESQLARALIAAEAAGIPPLIALNKSDLVEPFERAWQRLWAYRHMASSQGQQPGSQGQSEQANGHYRVLPLCLSASAEVDKAALLALLAGRTTLVLGPSGAGKSTLVNLLVPGAAATTGEISQALNSGRHTTTSTTLYWLDGARTTALIDSPGFQEFGLHHVAPTDLARYMPDLAAHTGHCRFHNCSHLHEPGCGVLAQVQPETAENGVETPTNPGGISARRYRIYSDLFAELSQSRY